MILTLPTRYPVLGRIRLGDTEVVRDRDTGEPVVDKQTGQPKTRPTKGEFLRFTSDDELTLRAVASHLGGDVAAWEGGEQAWQLTTESPSVECYLAPDPIDTAYERWGAGGCQRRCDGVQATFLAEGPDGMFMDSGDCRCQAEGLIPGDRDDAKKGACTVTARLRLVLPQVPGVGVWICTSHSKYAAMELPGQVALIQSLQRPPAPGHAPPLVPAEFAIERRSEKKPWEKYERKYIVPVLRVRSSLMQLVSANGGHASQALAPAPYLELDKASTTTQTGGGADAAGGKGYARTADAHSEAGEAHVPDLSRAEPAAEPTPVREGGSRAGRKAVGAPAGSPPPGESPFVRVIRTRAKSLGMTRDQLDALVTETVGKPSIDALDGPAEANRVLAALRSEPAER